MPGEDSGIIQKGLDGGRPRPDQRGTSADAGPSTPDAGQGDEPATAGPASSATTIPGYKVDFTLDPENAIQGIPISSGISLSDLYHGHIVVDKRVRVKEEFIKDVLADKEKFERDEADAISKAAGGWIRAWDPSGTPPRTDECKRIRAAYSAFVTDLATWITWLVANFPEGKVIYDSFEGRHPESAVANNLRRDIITELEPSNGPPITKLHNEWNRDEVCYSIGRFSFLVAPTGGVYVSGAMYASLACLQLPQQ